MARSSSHLATVITCEHGGNRVPAAWRHVFAGHQALLHSHRGWDTGALDTARKLSRRFDAPLVATTVTRLLVDANRTATRRSLFSELTRPLSPADRARILATYHTAHHARVWEAVSRELRRGRRVLHVASHTFTPVLRGVRRRADVALLYDPARPAERRFCRAWQAALRELAPGLRVRRNNPFLGKNKGLTWWLRQQARDPLYLGIELEINRRFWYRRAAWRQVQRVVLESLAHTRRQLAAARL